MTLNELLLPAVNWSLFSLTSFIIIFRLYISSICSWILNKYYSSNQLINQLTNELKILTDELNTISQQDQFALYTRKDRQKNSIIERIKNEKTNIDMKEKNLLTYIKLIFNIIIVFIMILLTITGQRHQTIPLFNFPFFRFPLVLWILTLNTFITTIHQIYLRYKTNKKT